MSPEPQIQISKQDGLDNWYIKPKGIIQAFVPDHFRDAIALHIIKNELTELAPPLLLAIQGPKGEGKSFQTREVCSQMGVFVIPISGALLSGSHEKDAVIALQNAYIFASALKDQIKRMTVILIDDFDLSVASAFEDRKYTVNTQLLNGFLMNLADDPTRCGQKQTHRIPIMLTGNNFLNLHGPLTRHGRMNFYEWKPSLEDKISIVASIFDSVLSSNQDGNLEQFVNAYASEPISFFVTLKDDMVSEAILKNINETGRVDVELIKKMISNMPTVDIKTLYALADKRQNNASPQNYLLKIPSAIKGYLPGGKK